LKYRNRVLGLMSLMMLIMYLDRVCISVSGPRMQDELHITPVQWGWVVGIFGLSYALFEIPSGILGDRLGPRRVITRIVLWWSAFTTFTGMATGFAPLLAIRFLFGMGEAGAYPNSGVVVARWFPLPERGRAFGVTLMASQLGGALAPLVVVPIQVHYGWRATFYLFGMVGIVWSAFWYWWFRDSPREMAGVSPEELAETRALPALAHHALPWTSAIRSGNLWGLMGLTFCYVYVLAFYATWLHTFLVKGRGYHEGQLGMSSLPFFVAAASNFLGGIASRRMVGKVGILWARRGIGFTGLAFSATVALAVMLVHNQALTLPLLSLLIGGITFQQPSVFAACLDIGEESAGAVVGAMNTAGAVGSFVAPVVFGYLVTASGSYDAPFVPMAALLLTGAFLWLRFDPTRRLAITS
jgi:ACS family glucarate transporter-like MFS transporter